jgi:hypothetical protein
VYQFDESSLTLRIGVCTNPKRQRGAFIKLIHCPVPRTKDSAAALVENERGRSDAARFTSE